LRVQKRVVRTQDSKICNKNVDIKFSARDVFMQ
jgi:hypothetical protein